MKYPFSSMIFVGVFNASVVLVLLHTNVPRSVVVAYLVFNAWQITANVITEITKAIRERGK